ncbi:hypothetical protein OEZ86_007337 [Tetradesmus obliquus]|nr:hypothetical protein OEZ86_007337 [Tetradesmus obliquus]
MSTGKRSFVEFAAGSEPNLTLITADGGRIPAHYDVLRLVCSCLRNAPASDAWDLSSLLVNGSPVSQSTVTALDGVYGLDEYDRAEYGYSGTLLKLQEGRRVALQQGKLYMDHQQRQQLDEQLAAQLEALLYVGFKLDLPQLLAPALRFARDNAPHLLGASLRGGTGALFSQRVLAAAGCADSSAAAALGRGLLLHPVGLLRLKAPVQAQTSWLPQPVEATCACCEEVMFTDVVYKVAKQGDEHDSIRFLGTLTRDVYSLKKGTRVHVRLSGRGGVMSVAGCNAFRTDLHFGVDAVLGPPHLFGSR